LGSWPIVSRFSRAAVTSGASWLLSFGAGGDLCGQDHLALADDRLGVVALNVRATP
jgi:hypothetical protein